MSLLHPHSPRPAPLPLPQASCIMDARRPFPLHAAGSQTHIATTFPTERFGGPSASSPSRRVTTSGPGPNFGRSWERPRERARARDDGVRGAGVQIIGHVHGEIDARRGTNGNASVRTFRNVRCDLVNFLVSAATSGQNVALRAVKSRVFCSFHGTDRTCTRRAQMSPACVPIPRCFDGDANSGDYTHPSESTNTGRVLRLALVNSTAALGFATGGGGIFEKYQSTCARYI